MDVFSIISFFLAFIIGITIHECAHAWMGYRLGDSTAKELGRISLNPLRHIDPIGTLLLPIIGLISPSQSFFGWAKPTPYNPHNLKEVKKDALLIALAGPISNILLAGLCVGLFYLSAFTVGFFGGLFNAGDMARNIYTNFGQFLYYVIYENLLLAFFNLVPIPPLDGSMILRIFWPRQLGQLLAFLNQFGFFILVMLSNIPGFNFVGSYVDTCVGFCLRVVGLFS